MKIVVLDGYTLNPGDISWDEIAALGDFTVYDRSPKSLVAERIGDAEVVFTNKTLLSRETMRQCQNLKYIGILATGYNTVDIKAAKELGITVTNVPAYSTQAVTQHVFALILELYNHVGQHSESVHQGRWVESIDFCYWTKPLMELSGKTLTIIGFGSIGQSVAKVALAFGMRVLAVPHDLGRAAVIEGVELVSLDEGLANGDIITVHCPLTEETTGLINSANISKMKDGAIVINTARGTITAETDVRAALDSGKLGGYGADVASTEPIRADNPLLGADNCVLTPHIAWAPRETRARLMSVAASNLKGFLAGNAINVIA